MFFNKSGRRVDHLYSEVDKIHGELDSIKYKILNLSKSIDRPTSAAPPATATREPGVARLDNADLVQRIDDLERQVSEMMLQMTERITLLAQESTKAMSIVESVSTSGSKSVQHMLQLSYESAALSQFLLMLGSYLEVNGIITRGGLRRIFDTLVQQMEPEMRLHGARVIGNLENWRNHT